MKLRLDFETYSEVSLEDCGAYVYAQHPSTDILSLSYKFNDEPTQIWKPLEGEDFPERISKHVEEGGELRAWNAFFEICIWEFVLHRKKGIPRAKLVQWHDVMAKSAAHGFPLKLEVAAEALRLGVKKDTIGKRILNKLSVPQRDKKKNIIRNEDGSVFRWYPHTAPDSFATLYKYNIRDTDVLYAADKALPELTPNERELWLFTQKINFRGIHVDTESIASILPKIKKEVSGFNTRLVELTKDLPVKIDKITQVQRITKLAKMLGYDLPNSQKETLEDFLLKKDLHPALREIVEMRLMGGKSSTGKYEKMLYSAAEDNRVRGTLVYCGAIKTGRFAGRDIQPHNYPKPTINYKKEGIEGLVDILVRETRDEVKARYKSFMHAASTATRGMICAPKGRILNIADYNAIEPRTLFWLAGEEKGLETYRNNGDIYVEMASDVFRKPVTKKDEEERWLGKQIILGCGYGMGPSKFVMTCFKYGREISQELAEISVYSYRNRFPKVPELWESSEFAAMKAITHKGKITKCADGKIQFLMRGQHLWCKLPAARYIVYPFARIENIRKPWGAVGPAVTYKTLEGGMWRRTSTFGGKLVENFCQAVARDFMAHGMMTADKHGYETVTTVHDEAVSESDENFGSIEEFCDLLVSPTDWGRDCPLKAEGRRQRRYEKL